ncbi:MAG: HIT family protein [Actinobacteria bacterium]|nr:HIT family protein [Actinomycetota bacterium]
MTTVFTRILTGDIPGTFVYRDEFCACFLTINPISDGHVLLCPIEEIDKWTDLPAQLSNHLFSRAHEISQCLQDAFSCERVGLIIAGFEVPHCHIHLIPTQTMDDLSFANAADSVTRDRLEQIAVRIREAMARHGMASSG